ncbi:MAG: exodeoxyribonuclease V subunit alpha [Deltaproteobacteria bacterium]|nr:exodeoxyribonuclease V subunit alpha [Deltaproteobacteria bacterium]
MNSFKVYSEPLSQVLSPLDKRFADFIAGLCGDPPEPDLWLASALVSWQTANGHICLPLEDFSQHRFPLDNDIDNYLETPNTNSWAKKLGSFEIVGKPGEDKPLVLTESRLYLNRYWNYERELIEFVKGYSSAITFPKDQTELQSLIGELFPESSSPGQPDWQKVAAITALLKPFCLISGSPGTGKTSIIFKILLLLLEENRNNNLRIALAAPTGKAANRLQESLRNWKERLNPCNAVNSIPEEVLTIHRLLGSRPHSSEFTFTRGNPLPYHIVIVDEGSMIDLPLLVKLMRALPEKGRLIILGDQNQLASVEAGAVFNDLCQGTSGNHFSPEFSSYLKKFSGEDVAIGKKEASGNILSDSIVVLQKNYRFPENSGIAKLSRLVNSGAGRQALALLDSGTQPDCSRLPDQVQESLARRLIGLYASYFEKLYSAKNPGDFLEGFREFMILSAMRRGPFGVEAINSGIELELIQAGIVARLGQGAATKPIMIVANDYRLGLFNGDIGVLFYDPVQGRCDAFFPKPDRKLRKISPSRLPAYESAFAMTVHKSQGSEFNHILLILPNRYSDLLTRELIYTGITRARKKIDLLTPQAVFIEAVSRRISRSSGIASALHPD